MVLVSLREAIHPNLPNVLKNVSPDISSNLGCRPRLESHYISGWADVRANVLLSAPIIEGRATSVMRSGLIQEYQTFVEFKSTFCKCGDSFGISQRVFQCTYLKDLLISWKTF